MKDPLWGVITSNKNEIKVGKKLKKKIKIKEKKQEWKKCFQKMQSV
jgi:hypothetical protein